MQESESIIRLTPGNVTYILIFLSACFPSFNKFIYMSYRFVFGSLYPTYLSYKALKHKNENECARLIMYWAVFAVFTFLEGFLDIFFGFWLPFYNESKIIFIFWLISPYTNGALILYENFLHKQLEENEAFIDDYIKKIKKFNVDLFWLIWNKSSVYFTKLLIIFFSRAQIAALTYVRNERSFKSIIENHNEIPMIESVEISQISTQIPEHNDVEMKPIIESIDSDDDANMSKERPIRNRRKREINDKDGISTRRITRSQLKNKIQ